MFQLMMKYTPRRFREAADDLGDTGNGAAAAQEDEDLGDELDAAQAAAKEPGDETLTAEEKAALPGKTEEEEERPREKDGKFAKKDKADASPMIPKGRVEEMIQKERERADVLERRLAEVSKQSAKEEEQVTLQQLEESAKELRKLERQALLKGDEDKAEEFAAQRDALNRRIAVAESSGVTAQVKEQVIESIRMQTTIDALKESYAQLDERSEEYDQELVDDVLDKQAGYMRRDGMTAAAALAKAAKYIMSRQAAEPEPEAKGLAKGQNIDRKAAAVAKNVDAASRQPPSPKQAGIDSDKSGAKGLPDVSKMSTDEFDALPEATKRRLMGDEL